MIVLTVAAISQVRERATENAGEAIPVGRSTIDIRQMTGCDLSYGYGKEFLDLLSQLSQVAAETIGSYQEHERLLAIYRWRMTSGITTVVAVDRESPGPSGRGLLVGTGSIIIERKLTGRVAGHIEDVVVLDIRRGTGIGGMLVESLLGIARKHNCYKVTLDCDGDKHGFYERCGFRGTARQ